MANSHDMIHLRDGEVVIYKRGNIPNWQARFKLGNGTWHRISTKTADLDRAKAKATEAYDRARFMEKEGLPQVTRRFDSIARLAIAEMEKALESGHGKKTYTTYIQVINKHLIPFFGKKQINQISYQHLDEFDTWRTANVGRALKASSITNHIAALNRIFDIAMSRGWVTKTQIPELKNRG